MTARGKQRADQLLVERDLAESRAKAQALILAGRVYSGTRRVTLVIGVPSLSHGLRGFTDVLLARGAARVYAVDVGHGQLAWKLRQDTRVVVLERTNARYLGAEHVPEPVDLVVCDASFIGLETLLPAPLALTRPGARLVALIKPQFEVGKGRVGKGGVVRDPALHDEVCEECGSKMVVKEGRFGRFLGTNTRPAQ